MKRMYTVKMSNGDIYGVPAEVIADNYAKFYESLGEEYQENYDAMIQWFDERDYEFADWAKNNMDWDDVKTAAVLLVKAKKDIDYQNEWVNGEYNLINVGIDMAKENTLKVYAVDFDGTLCLSHFPEIIEPKTDIIEHVKMLKATGHKLILWTCRCGKDLEAAVQWCKAQGLEFDAVNEALPEQREKWKNDTRKIWADYYIDDKAIRPDEL